MRSILISAALQILARIDWAALLDLVWGQMSRRVPPPLLDHVESLVVMVDAMPLSGPDKAAEVTRRIDAARGEIGRYVLQTPAHLINLAIEQAVARLHADPVR